ncbi:MAG TPA: ferredoxin family protein [Tepidiformaceae bacterium]
MPYIITEPCIGVKDASCVDVCPVDCIHTTEEAPQYYINPAQCIDCAACEMACPVSAIMFEDDVPAEWKSYISSNAEFFANS